MKSEDELTHRESDSRDEGALRRERDAPLRSRRLERAGRIELARRCNPAVLVYPVLLLILGLATSMPADYPLFFSVIAATTLPLALFRGWLVTNFAARYDRDPERTNALFRGSMILVSAVWGIFAASTVVLYGIQGPTPLVLICTAGILAGGTINHAIDLRGLAMFLGLTAGPWVLASFFEGSAHGVGLGCVSLVYCAALALEGRHLHRDYWRAAHTSEALLVANKTKSRFLASVSHELRTPLTGILGHLQLLEDGSVRQDQRRSLSGAKASAEALLRVINDLLDVSKVEAGKLELVDERFEVESVLRNCIETLAPRANARGLHLVREISPDVPRWVSGDAGRLQQILLNLVGNAIKFTEEGQVTIVVQLEEAREDAVCLKFLVRDTGIGIAPDRQAAIFDAFSQEDSGVWRRHGGTGLGLSICAHLVRLMGGRISVDSEKGEGSTFRFTLWCRRAEQIHPLVERRTRRTLASRLVSASSDPLRVLLAEDNPNNGQALTTLLRRRGHSVTWVVDGVHAVAAIEAEAHPCFDVVLLDVNMPGMDGVEAARAIRRLERERHHRMPIIALTADAQPRIRLRCREAGMDAFATKPIEADELCGLMDRLCATVVGTR